MSMLDDVKAAIGLGHQKADQALLWLAAIHANGEQVVSALNQQNEQANYHRTAHADVAAADGSCELKFRTRAGGWHLVSIAITGDTPSATTGCLIYRNETTDGVNLLHVVTYGAAASDEFSDGEYIPEGEYVIVRFIGQTPGTRCTANIKYLNLVQIPRLAQEG